MTPNPECATLDTSILDALHIMHDGKFLHLPVVDRGKQLCFLDIRVTFFSGNMTDSVLADGCIAACIDVLQITHAAISMVNFTSICCKLLIF